MNRKLQFFLLSGYFFLEIWKTVLSEGRDNGLHFAFAAFILLILVISLMWRREDDETSGDKKIMVICDNVSFDLSGVTHRAAVVMPWDELETVCLADLAKEDGSNGSFLLLSGAGEKLIAIQDTARGWSSLFTRLEELPGAEPTLMKEALKRVKPGSGHNFETLVEEAPEGQPCAARFGRRKRTGPDILSQPVAHPLAPGRGGF